MTISERVHALLRWSEKYTKTDMVYLAHGGFWLSVGTIVTALCSFILSVAFANLLPQETYGAYKYVISIAATIGSFTLTGLATSIIEAVSRGYEGVLWRAFIANLIWSAPSSSAALAGSIYYFLNGNTMLGWSLVLIAFIQPLTTSLAYGDSYLTGKKAFKFNTANYVVDNVVPMLALIGVMFLTKDALIIIATYFLANLITTALMFWFVVRYFNPNTREDPASITYGWHLSAMNIFGGLADNFDKIITFHFLGPAQLAVYSFALGLPNQTKLISKPLNNLMFPKFAERAEHELRGGMGDKTLRFFLWGLLLFILYSIVAPVFFKIFYPQYMESVFLSQIYAISFMATASAPMGLYLTAKRKVRAQYISTIGSNLFQLVSAAVGLWLGGLLGLILARVATRFVGAFLAMILYYSDKNLQ